MLIPSPGHRLPSEPGGFRYVAPVSVLPSIFLRGLARTPPHRNEAISSDEGADIACANLNLLPNLSAPCVRNRISGDRELRSWPAAQSRRLGCVLRVSSAVVTG